MFYGHFEYPDQKHPVRVLVFPDPDRVLAFLLRERIREILKSFKTIWRRESAIGRPIDGASTLVLLPSYCVRGVIWSVLIV